MKRFILWLLLVYTLVSAVFVGSIILIEKNLQRENNHPRKSLYIVNQTNDTISVCLSGSYTDTEKKKLKEKPDRYEYLPSDGATIPYSYSEGVKVYVIHFMMPYKRDKDIDFPEDFTVHIQNEQGKIELTRKQFFQFTKGKLSDNMWILYIDSLLLSRFLVPQQEELVATFY